jgi:hypothetical protein
MVTLRGTPVAVWVIYVLGLAAAAWAVVLEALASAAVLAGYTFGVYVSTWGLVLWAAVIVLAAVTVLFRRGRS